MGKHDKLSADINPNNFSQITDNEHESSSLAAFVKAIGVILSTESLDQKTQLSDRNIQGIMQLLSYNDYLEKHFFFRLPTIDTLIAEKLIKTVSLDRKGKDELIELFRAMKLEIEGNEPQALGNRMIVQRR